MIINRQLATNFWLSEFLHGETEMPSTEVLQNLESLAAALQSIRDYFGRQVIITSGYRNAKHNQKVGGTSFSSHMRGLAADILVKGIPPRKVQQHLKNWPGGLGCYETHTHVDIRPYKARWSK